MTSILPADRIRCTVPNAILLHAPPAAPPQCTERPNGQRIPERREDRLEPAPVHAVARRRDPSRRDRGRAEHGEKGGRRAHPQPRVETGDERHQHPLQLDVIERAVQMWSNPGEIVLTPFMGVGSEVFGAVANGRKGIGVELKESYYRQAVKNLPLALLPTEEQIYLLSNLRDDSHQEELEEV